MKKSIFLITCVLSLILAACGGSDDGGGGNPAKTPEKVVDPWAGIDSGSLDEDGVSERVRVLAFSDDSSIRYDGSDEGGAEEVCRQELREGTIYEVCMPLEDDPYFVMLPNNAFVWHPLMFERFGTELSCYEYTEGAARGAAGDCADIFASIAGEEGEDFDCQAGLVNGDKALKCSDDWAVVVNGEENESKTVCRVHLSNNSGRCLAAPQHGVADASLILPMQKSSWDGYRSNRDNNEQFAAGDAGMVQTPQDLPAGAKLSYRSEDAAICSVDNDDSDGGLGTVMVAPGVSAPSECRIVLTIEAQGFADRVIFADLEILKENDTGWGDYIRSNNYFYPGETLAAEAVVNTDPALTENVFASLDESVCTVDSETGELTAVAAGECSIRLTATAPNYLDKIIEKVVPVDALRQIELEHADWSIAWGAFPTEATVGVDSDPIAAPVLQQPDVNNVGAFVAVSGSGLTLSIAHVSGDCSYNGNNTKISFTDATACVFEVTASGKRGYADFSEQFSVVPGNGTFGLAWDGYNSGANAATFGDDPLSADAPSVTPALSDVSYAYSAEGGGCSVDAESGALTILGADVADSVSCVVTVVATRSGYGQESTSNTIIIAAKKLELTAPANPYGGIGAIAVDGGDLALVNAPASDEGVVTYASGDDTICTVAESGAITPVAAGTCAISAHLAGSGNYADSDSATLASIEVIAGAVPDAAAWGSDPYGSSPEVKVGESLAITTAPSGAGDPLYQSNDEGICTVAADGAVTGVAVGSCNIKFRFAGDSSAASNALSEALTIAIIKGDHPAPAADPYGASASLAFGETLEFEMAPEGFGEVTYSLKSGSEVYCALDADTGAIEGIAVGGNCIVQAAFAGDDNYEALAATDLQTIAVGQASQNIVFSDPYGAEASLVVDGTLALVSAPVASAGEGDGGALTYSTGDSGVCTVAADGTLTGVAMGECVVKVTAAVPADTNYAASSAIDIATIAVEKGALSGLAWNPPTGGRLGAELVLPAVNEGSLSGVSVVYSIKDAGDTGCAFKGTSGADVRTLVFESWGLCQVTATASKANYQDWVRDEYIRVRPGEITLGTMGAYASSAKIQVGASASLVPATNFSGLNPSDATASWQLARGERDCELINAATGAIRALQVAIEDAANPPECSLQVVARKDGYETFKSEIVSVPLQRGTIAGADVKYGQGINAILPVGGSVDVAFVSGANGLSVGITDIAVQGERDGSDADGICEVDNVAGSPTYGRVSAVLAPPPAEEDEEEPGEEEGDGEGQQQENTDAAELAAKKGDVCSVTVTVSAVGYEDKVLDAIELAVTGDLTVPADAVLAYGSNLQIGNSAAIAADDSALPADDGGETPVSIDWKYLAEGKDGKDGVCSVDEAGGDLSLGADADAGDVCLVYAVATAAGYTDVLLAPIEVMVAAGDLEFQTETGPTYPADLNIGGMASPTLPHNGNPVDDNSVPVSWGAWRVVGMDSTPAEKDGVCSVDADGVVSAGEAAAAGDTCQVYAVASADNYNNSDEMALGDPLNIVAKSDFASVTGPGYSDALTLRGYPVAISRAPAAGSVEVDWSYAAVGKRQENGQQPVVTEGICSVDGAGTVTPGSAAQAGDTCEIVATASAPGYNDGVAQAVVLELKDTLNSLTWAGFPTEGTVGVPLNLASNQPTADPSDATVVITASGGCSYSNSDVLTFDDATECVVTATASKSGYADFSRSYSITPSAGSLSPTWGSYASVTVSTTPVAAPDLGIAGSTAVYSEGTGSVGCTVAANGAVTGTAVGTCLVDVVLSKTGYADAEHTYTISVGKGSQTAPATDGNPYGTTPTLAVGASPKGISNALAAGQGALVYSVHSGDTANCQVDSGTGAVTAKAAGADNNCRIQAKYAGNANYLESGVSTIATIGIEKGDFTGVAWTGYASSPVLFSDTPPTANTPSSTPTTTTWTYTSTTTSVCTVNSSTGALTFVSVGTCTVEAYPTATGYNNGATQSASVVINKGTQTASTWSTNPYTVGGNLIVGGNAKGVNNLHKPTGRGNIEYRVFADHSTHCGVGGTSGVLRAKPAGAENDCKVEYRFIGDGNYQASPWGTVGTVSIDKGTLTGSWGSYPALVVGSTVSAPAITATSTNGSAVTVTPTYSAGTNTSDCTITAATGAVRGDSVGNSCQVDVTISATGYNNATHTYTISVGAGSISGLSWSPSQSTGTVGVSLTLDAMTTSTQGDIITYTRVSGNCSFADNTVPTLTFTGVANCVVTASVARTGYATWTSSQHSITVGKGANTGATTAVDAYAGSVEVDRHISPNNNLPTGGEGGLEYRVHDSATPASSSASSVCTIRQSDGRVTGAAGHRGSRCYIQARWKGNANYEASDWFSLHSSRDGILIIRGSQSSPSVPGNPYGASPQVAVGSTLDIVNPPASDAGRVLIYSVSTTGTCSINSADGTVTGKGTGPCSVLARYAQSDDYRQTGLSSIGQISVVAGTIAGADWTGYSSATATFGGTAPTPNAPTATTAGVSWAYASTTTSVCTVASTTSAVLTMVGTGTCTVTATPSKTGYTTGSAISFDIEIAAGTISGVSWSPASSGTNGTPLTLDAVSGGDTSDTVTYSVVSGPCAFGSGDATALRTLTFSGTGACVVKAVVERNHHNNWDSGSKTITVSAAGPPDMSFSTTPEASYTGNLVYITSNLHTGGDVSQTADFTLPGTDDDGTVAITWHFSVAGFDSSNNAKNNVCAVKNADATNADHSKIYAHANAALNDICRVTVVGRASGYNDYTSVATVDLAVKKLGRWASGNEPSYTDDTTDASTNPPVRSNAIVVGSTATASGGTLMDLGGGEEATYTHTFTGMDNDGSPADNDNVCSLDATSRQLGTGSAASAGDTCVVRFVASSNGYHDVVTDVTVNVLGTQAAPDANVGTAGLAYGSPPDPLDYSNGDTASISTAPSGGGGHGDLEYRDNGAGACVVASDGTVSVSFPSVQCVIQARYLGNNQYDRSPWVTIWEFTPVP